jgi:hypothetical protein
MGYGADQCLDTHKKGTIKKIPSTLHNFIVFKGNYGNGLFPNVVTKLSNSAVSSELDAYKQLIWVHAAQAAH